MAIIQCPECGQDVSDKAEECIHCGFPLALSSLQHEEQHEDETISPSTNVDVNESPQPLNNQSVYKSDGRKKTLAITSVILVVLVVGFAVIHFYLNHIENKEIKNIDMGTIGNKITVDGTVAYVAGENKIIVPYNFSGSFGECESAAYEKNLKGCDNPRLPTDETNVLPEEVTREIISFYGDIGGFWTSIKVTHGNIEFSGYDLGSLHYAGMMDNYFSVNSDNVAQLVWGYNLNATYDTEIMGLLVVYDINADEFEFIDVEDTADPNYSTQPTLYDEVMAEESESLISPSQISISETLNTEENTGEAEEKQIYEAIDSETFIVENDPFESLNIGESADDVGEVKGYETIINEYIQACQADDFDSETFPRLYQNVNEGMMFYYHLFNTSGFYYCYKDINNDGAVELFIGCGSEDHISIVDLYLLDGDKVVKAIDNDTLGDRSKLILYTDGTLYEDGSNSAGSGTATIYRVNNTGTALETVYAYEYEYTDTDGWYHNENETISADDFYQLLNDRTEDTSFTWNVLAEPKA